jgi:hypothetical protein
VNLSARQILLGIALGMVMRGTAMAADFGIVLAPAGEYVSDAKGSGFGFTGTLTPWFFAAPGEKISLYLSGKMTFAYERQDSEWAWPPLFELERTELNFRPVQSAYLTFGRQRYRDSGGMIAAGLFDGISGSAGFSWARLSLGVLYAGFLYKETAEILMTPEDRDRYFKPLDYADPETYFASRRMLLPLDLEFSDLASRLSLAFTLLAQFDLNDAPSLHTQYLEARFGLEPVDDLRFAITGMGGLAESEGTELRGHLAAALSAEWALPGGLTDMLSAELRWGSGAVNNAIVPFMPVSGITQGTVFAPLLPGLMDLRAAYTARPHKALSLSGEAVVFWRTDVETFKDDGLDGASKDRYLGTELQGSLIWALQSALRLSAGGGVFFPGGAFVAGTAIRWKINTGILLAL